MSGNRIDNPAEPVLTALQALIEILQLPRSIVKYAPELGKLVFSMNGDAMFEIATRQHLRPLDQLFKGPCNAARDDQSQSSGDQEGENDRGRHKKKNTLLYLADIGCGLGMFGLYLPVDFFHQGGGGQFKWS